MEQVELLAFVPEEKRTEALDYLGTINPIRGVETTEQVNAFVEKNSLFKSAFDSKVSKANETFKSNNQLKVNEQIEQIKKNAVKEAESKFNPEVTDEQKRFKNLQDQFDSISNESIKDKQLLIAKEHVKGKLFDGIDLGVYLGKTREETILNLDTKLLNPYQDHYKSGLKSLEDAIDAEVKKRLNGTADPKRGKKSEGGELTRSEFEKMGASQQMETINKGIMIIDS